MGLETSEVDILATVRAGYGAIAAGRGPSDPAARATSERVGYQAEDLASVPGEANLGLGCGNPTAFAMLRPGDTVLDLGSGGGLDAFLAANVVGESGRVIGVDTTPEMLASARASAVKSGVAHRVEFREGVIEELPVTSGSVDVILSNCVINLSADKAKVFREAFRVLKPGGRLAVSDLALSEPLPADLASMAAAHVACLGGATPIDGYLDALRAAGFVDLAVDRTSAATMLDVWIEDPLLAPIIEQIGAARLRDVADTVWSYRITAHRPVG